MTRIMERIKLLFLRFVFVPVCVLYYLFLYMVRILSELLRCRWVCTKQRVTKPTCLSNKNLGTHGFLTLRRRDGIKIHYVANGDPQGRKLLLLLHGFPEFWFSWRHQLADLKDEYYTVAVDMTGFGESSKPEACTRYDKFEIASDMREVVRELGYDTCLLVGHDWGGVIGYTFASQYPEVVEKLVAVNIPHPSAADTGVKQLAAFMYVGFFQIPYLPERFLARNDFEILNFIRKMANSNFTEEYLEAYKYTFQAGGLTSPLNYYRNVLTSRPLRGKIKPTTMIIWGRDDPICLLESGQRFLARLEIGRLEVIDHANHAPQYDQPAQFNALLRKFFNETS